MGSTMKKTRQHHNNHNNHNKKSVKRRKIPKLTKKNNRRMTNNRTRRNKRKQVGGENYDTLGKYGTSNDKLVKLDEDATHQPDNIDVTPRSSSMVGEAGSKGDQSYIPETEFEENNPEWSKISEKRKKNESNENSSGMFSWVSKLIEWFIDLMTPTDK